MRGWVRTAIYVLGGAAGFILVFFLIHLPHGPEHWSADAQIGYLSKHLEQQHPRIALIEITNSTLDRYPYVSPVDRKLLADLVSTIADTEPKAIGLDFIFDRATEESKDERLLQAIRSSRSPCVLGALDDDLLSQSERAFQATFIKEAGCKVGHLYLGEVRSNPLIISEHVIRKIAEPSDAPERRSSFAEVLAGFDGTHNVDADRQIAWLLPPTNETETFLRLPAEQVLAYERLGLHLKDLLHDKFVLIGGRFPDRDQHLTPLSVWSEERFSGLFIHAQVLAQLLADDHLYGSQQWFWHWLILPVVAFIGFLTGRRDRSGHNHLLIELASVATLIVVSILAFRIGHFIFPFVSVLLVWLAGVSGGHYSRLARASH